MARNRPPSFDFYPEDFLAGTMHLHPACIGIYIRLLCFQWSHGAIPFDRRQLMQITGAMPDELDTYLSQVMDKFELGDDGLYRNARLEREREKKIGFYAKQSANGSKGGRPKKNAQDDGLPADSDSTSDTPGEQSTDSTAEKPKNNPWVSSGLSKEKPKQKPPIGKLEVGSTEVPKKEKRNVTESLGDWDIPGRLDTAEIRELLVEFEAMRVRKRKPIRDRRASSKVFKHFDDVAHLTYALEVCIANEWQGLDAKYRPPDKSRPVQQTFADMRVERTKQAIEEFANG